MQWRTKRKSDLVEDLDILIGDLCTKWGFCNRLTANKLVADGQELSAETFSSSVLYTEGMSPEYETQWRRRIRDTFTARYGKNVLLQSYQKTPD